MIKLYFVILLVAIINSQIYSQTDKSVSAIEDLEHWSCKGSNDIIDYVLKLKPMISGRLDEDIYFFMVIRAKIGWWDLVEYQITLYNKYCESADSKDSGALKLMLIFEHPIGKSIRKQYVELKKVKSDISFEEAEKKINIKRDTVIIDSTFQYYSLINEMYNLELPIIYKRFIWLEGTMSQIYMKNISNEHYSVLPYGESNYKFTEWIDRLFMAMIDHFHALYPYLRDKKEK